MNDWKKVYENSFEHKVRIMQALLSEADIKSVVMNKKDSAYLFGAIELYVQADDVLRAKDLINKESL